MIIKCIINENVFDAFVSCCMYASFKMAVPLTVFLSLTHTHTLTYEQAQTHTPNYSSKN